MSADRAQITALASLVFNTACSACHIAIGAVTASWWLLTIGIYYLILSVARLVVLYSKGGQWFLVKFTGAMLVVLSVSLVGTVILAFVKDRGTVFPLITMLAIATYTFTKITLAIIKWIQARKYSSAKMLTLRNISLANAVVSIFSLQRSMLVSFEGMSAEEIRIMNVATGFAVCVIVFLLGVNLVKNRTDAVNTTESSL